MAHKNFGMRAMSTVAELRQYQVRVEEAMMRALSTGKPEVFENEGPEHARIVLDTMLEHAQVSLDVIAGSLDKRIWTASYIRRFLERCPTACFRVMLPGFSGSVPETSALKEIVPHERICVRRLPLALDAHFAIVDGSHARFEYDCATRAASVNFGDASGVGERLTRMFNKLWIVAGEMQASPTLFDRLGATS